MLEEIDVIVASLLDILLRTILEITSRPQPAGSTMRLQFQDVTVRPRLTKLQFCLLKPQLLWGWVSVRIWGIWTWEVDVCSFQMCVSLPSFYQGMGVRCMFVKRSSIKIFLTAERPNWPTSPPPPPFCPIQVNLWPCILSLLENYLFSFHSSNCLRKLEQWNRAIAVKGPKFWLWIFHYG